MRDWTAWSRSIAEREALPFAWDTKGQDCVRFAAATLLALTGRDVLGSVTWRGERGAMMQISRLGRDGGLAAAVSARLAPIAPAHAHRGDIAGIADPRLGVALMVIEGETLVAPGERGLRRAPRPAMICAWSAPA